MDNKHFNKNPKQALIEKAETHRSLPREAGSSGFARIPPRRGLGTETEFGDSILIARILFMKNMRGAMIVFCGLLLGSVQMIAQIAVDSATGLVGARKWRWRCSIMGLRR